MARLFDGLRDVDHPTISHQTIITIYCNNGSRLDDINNR